MGERHWPITHEVYGTGRRKIAIISCHSCDNVAKVGVATGMSLLPNDQITKKFLQVGWIVGPTEAKDECADCQFKRKKDARPMDKKRPTIHLNYAPNGVGNGNGANHAGQQIAPVVPKAAPQKISRDDRRIIYNALEAAYDSPETGYKPGWSDQRVATDLGVKREWIIEVRRELFGEIATNSEMTEFLKEATGALNEARKMLDESIAIREEIKKMVASPGFAISPAVIERIAKVERLATAVRKVVVEG